MEAPEEKKDGIVFDDSEELQPTDEHEKVESEEDDGDREDATDSSDEGEDQDSEDDSSDNDDASDDDEESSDEDSDQESVYVFDDKEYSREEVEDKIKAAQRFNDINQQFVTNPVDFLFTNLSSLEDPDEANAERLDRLDMMVQHLGYRIVYGDKAGQNAGDYYERDPQKQKERDLARREANVAQTEKAEQAKRERTEAEKKLDLERDAFIKQHDLVYSEKDKANPKKSLTAAYKYALDHGIPFEDAYILTVHKNGSETPKKTQKTQPSEKRKRKASTPGKASEETVADKFQKAITFTEF